MSKPTLNAVALGLGVLCAAWLAWLWRADRSAATIPVESGPVPLPSAPPAAPVAAVRPPDQTAGRNLIAQLQRMLARANTRAKEAVLTFKDEAALRRFRERAKLAGLTIIGDLGALRTVRVGYDQLKALENDMLQNAGDYDAVAANFLVGIPHPPAKQDRADVDQVPFQNRTLNYLGVDERARTAGWGSGTTIAILDTGIGADPTFGQGRVRYLDIGMGTTPGNGREDGHGTSVASLAAGLSPDAAGVAPGANLLSIRVTDANGTSDIFTLSQAIVAAVDAGAKVINVSLGGYATNAALNAAIGYASDRGAVIVAAAGNDQAAQLAWPAADPRVVSVGAIDAAEQQVTFSNSSDQLQLTAPGYGVQTAWLNGQRAYVDGTSASAPLVSGAIAALISQNPSLTPQQAVALLERTASDGGAPGSDPAYGNGILNLGWAMNANTAGYVDTAVSSHYFNATNNTVDVVVQNRSAQAVAGMNLTVAIGAIATDYAITSLAPGASTVVKVPIDASTLRMNGTLGFTTQLTNPPGVNDKVPANNRKSSVLSAPGK
jgi:hypothetical protein